MKTKEQIERKIHQLEKYLENNEEGMTQEEEDAAITLTAQIDILNWVLGGKK